MGSLSAWHWIVVLVVIVILFGSKRLPDAARGLGRSLRILKSEVKEMQSDGSDAAPNAAASNTAAPQELPPAQPTQRAATEHTDPRSA